MIDTDKYVEFLAKHAPSTKKRIYVAETSSGRVQEELWRIAMSFLIEVERLREENEKQNNVLTTLDEMIQRSEEHVELMKALEQGLGLPETWKEMIE